MNWSANSHDTPFGVTHVGALAVNAVGARTYNNSVSTPTYRRHTATQSPLPEPSLSLPWQSAEAPLSPPANRPLSAATAYEVPSSFLRVAFSRAAPPSEASVVEEDRSASLGTPAMGTRKSTGAALPPRASLLDSQRTHDGVATPAALHGGPDVFSLRDFSPFHRPTLRASLSLTPQSLDTSLRSSIDCSAGGTVAARGATTTTATLSGGSRLGRKSLGTGLFTNDASFLSGTTRSLMAQPGLLTGQRPSALGGGGGAVVMARRLTHTESGPLAAHRLLPDPTLGAVCAFLEAAGREVENVALRQAIAHGESCLFAGSDEVGGSNNSQRSSLRQRLSESASTPLQAAASAPRRSSPHGPDQSEEEDILRLVEATHFPFSDRYNGYRFEEAWFDADGPVCAVSGSDSETDEPTEGQAAGPRVGAAVHACVALTEDPAFCVHGLLLDPVTGRFLFRGHAFHEEARVLTTRLYADTPRAESAARPAARPPIAPVPTPPSAPGSKTAARRLSPPRPLSPPTSAALLRRAEEGRAVKVLQRDFISVAKPDGCGFMVQSFSLLPLNAPVEAHKQQLVPAEMVRRVLLPLVGAATLTRAFPLAHVARELAPWDVEATLPAATTTTTAPEASVSVPPVGRLENSTHRVVPAPPPRTAPERLSTSSTVGGGTLERMGAVDAIRTHLLHYRIGRFRAHARLYMASVRRVQRFLRGCLAKKQRALQRMLRLWRRLEVESRLKLAHYDAPRSSVERVNMVANTVLQQHMLTTRESKVRLIAELWQQRHELYVQWQHHTRRHGASRPMDAGSQSGADEDSVREKRRLTSRLSRTAVIASMESDAALTDAQRRTRTDRDQALRHERFGWYMSAESLLFESHKRLLEGLKQSVLSMEQVRYELERAAVAGSTADALVGKAQRDRDERAR